MSVFAPWRVLRLRITLPWLCSLLFICLIFLCAPVAASDIDKSMFADDIPQFFLQPSFFGNAKLLPNLAENWLEKMKYASAGIAQAPVSVQYMAGFGQGRAPVFQMQTSNNTEQTKSLFSILDDGEALLDMLKVSGDNFDKKAGFEKVLADTLNFSFLSMGSKLNFHVNKHFLPYLGGGIVYGELESGAAIRNFNRTSTGWEAGVGFVMLESPLQFGVDFLYRGIRFEDKDESASEQRGLSAYPICMDYSGYFISCGFSYAF